MELIAKLKRFYKVEETGLLHYEDELLDIAYALASFIEENADESDGEIFFSDQNFAKDPAWLAEQMLELRTHPTSTLIDTVVNHMHQGLLDAIDRSGEMSEEMMMEEEGDIAQYLLNRC